MLHNVRQGFTFHIFHHQEVDPGFAAYVLERANVRVVELGDDSGFPLEATDVRCPE